MLDYSNDPIGQLLYDLQDVGLTVNELKSHGEKFIPIETYEHVLEALITVTNNYQELVEQYDTYSRRIGETLGIVKK